MTSTKNDLLYFFLVVFNYITDLFTYYNIKLKEFVEIYNQENRGKWIFLPNNNPELLPLDTVSNINTNNNWIYDSNQNKLSYSNSTNKIKINWLSVELIKNTTVISEQPIKEVINLDKFFENFELYSDPSNCPPLMYIVYCICIKHKVWFLPEDNIRLVIIDDMGNDINLDIHNQDLIKNCLSINNDNEIVLSLNKKD